MRMLFARLSMLFTAFTFALVAPNGVQAQTVTSAGNDLGIKVETLAEGLTNPCGLAIRPGMTEERTEIFISDSGAGRIVKIQMREPSKLVEVVTGFPTAPLSPELSMQAGPLGIGFFNSRMMVVGGNHIENQEHLLRVYNIIKSDQVLKVDQMDHSNKPVIISSTDRLNIDSLFQIQVPEKADILYATSMEDSGVSHLFDCRIQSGKINNIRPLCTLVTDKLTPLPMSLAISPKGHLFVGMMGEISDRADSTIGIYSAEEKELKVSLRTELKDITALAYSPYKQSEDSLLYALDGAFAGGIGGLYRIDAADGSVPNVDCKATLLVELERPTAMTFGEDGVLYITLAGSKDGNGANPTGKLIKVTCESFKAQPERTVAAPVQPAQNGVIRPGIRILPGRAIRVPIQRQAIPAKPAQKAEKKAEEKPAEDKKSEDKKSEDKKSEEKKSDDKTGTNATEEKPVAGFDRSRD